MPRILTRKYWTTWAVGVVLCGAAVGAAQGQKPIKEIRIVGLQALSEEAVRSQLRSAVGQPYEGSVVEEDRRRLLAGGRILEATASVEEQADGVILILTVHERPTVREIRFLGNRKFNETKLTALIPLKVGDSVDLFAAKEGRQAILDQYREKGYGSAVVTLDEAKARVGELVYTIEEGPRVRIRKILFEGATAYPHRRLQGLIESATYLWIFRDGKFNVDTVESDAAAIQNFYRDEGYLDAKASYRLEFDDTRSKLTLIFLVAEGVRYTLESLDTDGNTVYSDDELLALTTLKLGDFLRRPILDRDVKAVAAHYHDHGYIYAEVVPVRVFSETEGLAAVTLKITEADSYTVGRIVVRGNQYTKDKVVRRSLDLFPGDVFDLSKTRKAEEALRDGRIFDLSKITPVGEAPGVRDIVMDVEEGADPAKLIFGAGVTSNNGLVGTVVLELNNFDILDSPRTFKEFIKGQAFRGAGQRLRIEAEPGTEVTRFRVDFTEPYLFDVPINFGTSAYYFTRGRDSYDEQRYGGNVSFGKRLKRGLLKDWYSEIAFRLEEVTIDDLELFAPRDVQDVEGGNTLTSAKFAIARDRTDNRFVPSRGDVLRFAWEQYGAMGGDHVFGKFTAGYSWYKTLHVDAEERKGVLALKASTGAIAGDSPMFERFYGGGIGSIRGFEFRGVSPRKGLAHTAVGGDFMLLTGAEYSFPLYSQILRGVLFTDMGTVEEDLLEVTTWRASVGAGLRLTLDVLGPPVPMEFNFAAPVSSNDEDDEQVFSFLIGISF